MKGEARTMKENIYGIGKDNVERYIQHLRTDIVRGEIGEQNVEDIIKLIDYLSAHGYSLGRKLKYLTNLKTICKLYWKPIRGSSKEDLMKLVQAIENEEKWSTSTKADFKLILRMFFKWMKGLEKDDPLPEEVSWIKVKDDKKQRLPESILVEEEVMRLAMHTDNERDKAFILAIYETGCRIGEILTMQIKNIEFDDYGALLRVEGKTGARRVRIVGSAPALKIWLEKHPFKTNHEAYLWINPETDNPNRPLTYRAIAKMLSKVAKRAGIYKKVNPHAFRHSRATYLANKLTEPQMKEFFGWTRESDMVGTYVHLSGRNVDEAILKTHGIVLSNNNTSMISLKICEKCNEKNHPASLFCHKCGSVIDIAEKKKAFIELVYKLLQRLADRDPETKKEWQKLVKEEGMEWVFE